MQNLIVALIGGTDMTRSTPGSLSGEPVDPKSKGPPFSQLLCSLLGEKEQLLADLALPEKVEKLGDINTRLFSMIASGEKMIPFGEEWFGDAGAEVMALLRGSDSSENPLPSGLVELLSALNSEPEEKLFSHLDKVGEGSPEEKGWEELLFFLQQGLFLEKELDNREKHTLPEQLLADLAEKAGEEGKVSLLDQVGEGFTGVGVWEELLSLLAQVMPLEKELDNELQSSSLKQLIGELGKNPEDPKASLVAEQLFLEKGPLSSLQRIWNLEEGAEILEKLSDIKELAPGLIKALAYLLENSGEEELRHLEEKGLTLEKLQSLWRQLQSAEDTDESKTIETTKSKQELKASIQEQGEPSAKAGKKQWRSFTIKQENSPQEAVSEKSLTGSEKTEKSERPAPERGNEIPVSDYSSGRSHKQPAEPVNVEEILTRSENSKKSDALSDRAKADNLLQGLLKELSGENSRQELLYGEKQYHQGSGNPVKEPRFIFPGQSELENSSENRTGGQVEVKASGREQFGGSRESFSGNHFNFNQNKQEGQGNTNDRPDPGSGFVPESNRSEWQFSTTGVRRSPEGGSRFQETFEQIVAQARLNLKNRQEGTMEIKLRPEYLGGLRMRVALEEGQLRAHFQVENHLARDILENNMGNLRDSLSREGFTFDDVDVNVQSDSEDAPEEREGQFQPEDHAAGEPAESEGESIYSGLQGNRVDYRV